MNTMLQCKSSKVLRVYFLWSFVGAQASTLLHGKVCHTCDISSLLHYYMAKCATHVIYPTFYITTWQSVPHMWYIQPSTLLHGQVCHTCNTSKPSTLLHGKVCHTCNISSLLHYYMAKCASHVMYPTFNKSLEDILMGTHLQRRRIRLSVLWLGHHACAVTGHLTGPTSSSHCSAGQLCTQTGLRLDLCHSRRHCHQTVNQT